MPHSIRRIGFPCVIATGELTTCHNFRLASLSEERLQRAIDENLDDLGAILDSMAQGPMRLFRIGSSFVPFASHPAMVYDWPSMCRDRLRRIGERYLPLGFRFSLHPGQYNVLNSPKPEVVEAARRELEYSSLVLDLLGCDGSHKVVLHGGGLYGDAQASEERLLNEICRLPESVHRRLVLENDERFFNLESITRVASRAEVSVVFDLHHHQIFPSPDLPELLERVRATWSSTPKVHLSSQRPASRIGAHDDFLHEQDLATLISVLPFEADLMVEAKMKDQAALQAWEWLCQR